MFKCPNTFDQANIAHKVSPLEEFKLFMRKRMKDNVQNDNSKRLLGVRRGMDCKNFTIPQKPLSIMLKNRLRASLELTIAKKDGGMSILP